MLAFPLPKLGNKIALVAWTQKPGETRGQGRVAECTRFDQPAFKAFRDAFRGKGPSASRSLSYDRAADEPHIKVSRRRKGYVWKFAISGNVRVKISVE